MRGLPPRPALPRPEPKAGMGGQIDFQSGLVTEQPPEHAPRGATDPAHRPHYPPSPARVQPGSVSDFKPVVRLQGGRPRLAGRSSPAACSAVPALQWQQHSEHSGRGPQACRAVRHSPQGAAALQPAVQCRPCSGSTAGGAWPAGLQAGWRRRCALHQRGASLTHPHTSTRAYSDAITCD